MKTTTTTTKGTKAEPVKDPATKIDLLKVKAEIVDEYLGKLGLATDGAIADRLLRLVTFFRAELDARKDGGKFDSTCTCGGRSDARLLRCPFCGDADTAPDLAGKGAEKEAIAEMRAKTNGHAKAQPLVQVPRQRRRVDAQTTLPTAAAANEAVPAPSESIPIDAKVVANEAFGIVGESSGDLVLAPKTTIVAEEDKTATVDDLDQSVAKIHALARHSYETAWDLGQALADNFRRKLYLQRRGLDGAPLYSGWADFVRKEIPISVQYSYTTIDIATGYSRSAFVEYGIKKLLMALRIPEEDRAQFLAENKHKSLREVKDKVVEIVGEANGVKRDTGRETVGVSTNAVSIAIEGKRWDEAGQLLRNACAAALEDGKEAGFDSQKGREPIAARLGVDDRTLRKYVQALAEENIQLRTLPPSKGGAPKKATGKKAPMPEPKKAAKKTPAPEPKKKAPPANPLVTVPITLGKTKLPLLARPLKRNAAEKPAKKLGDDPWAIETLPNGVVVRYAIIAGRNGHLQLVIDRTRAS